MRWLSAPSSSAAASIFACKSEQSDATVEVVAKLAGYVVTTGVGAVGSVATPDGSTRVVIVAGVVHLSPLPSVEQTDQ
jgi:hypothetical protein